ncbi:MAG: DUF2785 domain-containing protein [Clostridium sp.]|uniref:DUF2785 domain-containing protein n=1 Tax=Clostridium sp. TaxID=1506 RepID=UPI00304A9541
MKLCLSEEHLFCGVEAIISVNNKVEEEFLNESEVLHVYEEVMRYFRNEKDLRGYVKGKGWITYHLFLEIRN